jgi:hypothetical protein
VSDFNTPLSPIHGPYTQKFNKETLKFHNISNQTSLADSYRIFHPTVTEHIFLSSGGNFFQKSSHHGP